MSEFIEFQLMEKEPKTSVYSVVKKVLEVNTKDKGRQSCGYCLGTIKWHGPWRQYCFFPNGETIFSGDCMRYIIDFIKELMEKRKNPN